MKIKSKILFLSVLLVGSLIVTPTLASTTHAGVYTRSMSNNLDTVTIDFIDCTAVVPLKKELTMPRSEWNEILDELHLISTSGASMSEVFSAQLRVFQNHNLVSKDTTMNDLFDRFTLTTHTGLMRSLQQRNHRILPLNNTIFSALSALSFTMENANGSAFVFGLNTFINYIGFNIISLHKGYATTGIQTNGLISKSVPPGEYAGAIFGFFGYWFGTKISTGIYSDLTVAGLAIITVWVPVP
jgi:hypothetical protein